MKNDLKEYPAEPGVPTEAAETAPGRSKYSRKMREMLSRIKHLNGDPHHVGMGMAIGVFVGVTPTIPLHTVLALLMAFIFRASKPAAMIGVWFSNPVTIPFFYIGSYKIGAFILGHSMPFDMKYDSIIELTKVGLDVTLAMLLGGVILGIVPGIASYFITRKIVAAARERSKRIHEKSPSAAKASGQKPACAGRIVQREIV